MINIDIKTFADAIHGGPQPTDEELTQALSQHGVALDSLVLASYSGPLFDQLRDALKRNNITFLDHIHPLMLYVFPRAEQLHQTQAILEQYEHLYGQEYQLRHDKILPAIQHAIVSLRNTDLARHQQQGSEPDRTAENSARDQALQALRLSGDLAATQFWLQLTLYKHRGRLVSARRRLIEFISQLCAELECITVLDHVFKRSVHMIQNTFAYPALEQLFMEHIKDFVPFCFRGTAQPSSLVRDALAFMDQHYQAAISLSDIANALHVSSAHLSRKVKQETGSNVTDILHELRLSNAKLLLSDSDEGILSIAFDCGFPSVEHFHRVFKRNTGITPKQWRNLNS